MTASSTFPLPKNVAAISQLIATLSIGGLFVALFVTGIHNNSPEASGWEESFIPLVLFVLEIFALFRVWRSNSHSLRWLIVTFLVSALPIGAVLTIFILLGGFCEGGTSCARESTNLLLGVAAFFLLYVLPKIIALTAWRQYTKTLAQASAGPR